MILLVVVGLGLGLIGALSGWQIYGGHWRSGILLLVSGLLGIVLLRSALS